MVGGLITMYHLSKAIYEYATAKEGPQHFHYALERCHLSSLRADVVAI